jgi:RNA polymerase primary sigma factor
VNPAKLTGANGEALCQSEKQTLDNYRTIFFFNKYSEKQQSNPKAFHIPETEMNSIYTAMDNQDLFNSYIKDITGTRLLSKQEERALIHRVKRSNLSDRNKLICANLRIVIKVALMYANQGLPISDLINEGNIGLMTAVEKFDPSRKVRFTSYAIWWIRQAIVKALFEKGRTVRLSVANELAIRRIRKHKFEIEHLLLNEPAAGKSKKRQSASGVRTGLEKLIALDRRPLSLDAPTGNNSLYQNLMDKIPDTSVPNPASDVEHTSLLGFLNSSLNLLKPNERKVITYTFGLDSCQVMNLREIGDMLGLSKERVRQIKQIALRKLRNTIKDAKLLLAA